ncbi:luciferin 4-monooxygenase-like [Musca vetustissima]|uniref:luciferin 4-monooxygenase-like n=1 Tax=Musca vetustissima TaxID=27455 RepID=UPI002AB764DB|nr:luciferin 4-monooxygenase-like [Musca vetustissima]
MAELKTFYDKQQKIWSGPRVAPLHNIEHHSIGRILFGQMRLNPHNVLQIDAFDNTQATSGELLTWGIRIALHLKKLRMRHDDIVGVAARNTLKLTSVVLGCLFNGNPMHAVNPNYQEAAISHSFGITKPQIIFCDGCDYEKIRKITASFQPTIYTMCDHIQGVPTILDLLEPTKMERFYQPEKQVLGGDQTIVILSSSGTTGLSKAVTVSASKITLENAFSNIDEVFYTSSGIDWASGFMSLLQNCYTGCTRIINRKPFNAPDFIEMVKKYKITTAILGPIQFVELLDCPDFTSENMASLQLVTSGGGYVSKQLVERVQRVLPQCMLCIAYGLTETGAVTINVGVQENNSVGKLIPNVQLRIIDEEGRSLGPNQTGEILVRLPNCSWAGYYGNPIETQKMMDSLGWYHTGDLGYVDEEGYLYIVDRIKDILKYNRMQYWPGEIENTIRELPDVADCCVVGIYNERYGDVAGALVMKKSGSPLTTEQVVEHVRNRLREPQKQLHHGAFFVEKLPQNINGKILKREAREILKSFLEQSSSSSAALLSSSSSLSLDR